MYIIRFFPYLLYESTYLIRNQMKKNLIYIRSFLSFNFFTCDINLKIVFSVLYHNIEGLFTIFLKKNT